MNEQKLVAILKQHFGFTSFRPGQLAVLQSLINNHNTLAVLPTGAGKTLIYQMFGLIQRAPILIVSPLLSLMQDQVARLQYLGVKRVVAINSMLDWQQKQVALAHLGNYQYIYISPEMLANSEVLNQVRAIHPGLVVIDEAHCLSQWGPDFRPEYLNLKGVLDQLGPPLTLMLTATASRKIQADIIAKLGLTQPVTRVVESIDRPNIYLAVTTVSDDKDKQAALLRLVNTIVAPGVVYFLSRKRANQMALWLMEKTGLRVAAYHSGLSDEERFKIQHQFMNDQLDIICATSAFGMGIDKNNIRFVIHYHLPADLEAYMQEIGRAGRDGKQSIAVLLYQDGDESLPAHLTVNNIPDESIVNAFFRNPQEMAKLADQDDQIRILSFYWRHAYSADQVNRIFSLRVQQQRSNIATMMNYVHAKQCRRKVLLEYFDQTAPPHTKRCCNLHTPALPIEGLGLMNTVVEPNSEPNLDWRRVIKKLFKNDD
ncbi:ATP-dependent DNA helicase RecQ [Lactobacillus sp. Sy-1]|uniref:RecQ family ATP-dependent DNA helicase n=1 Tax=Lactobacillus sp. Sy-1 TaxID=2109645 RepID=UPI001C56F1DD|nr:ATP-dependent DNA helicase RecQ [Lactobacillus sp. Sy-1]MBW1605546.1 ATP-dependent DNA helicase RecQ [Lactobacillus sp. Sy-1]